LAGFKERFWCKNFKISASILSNLDILIIMLKNKPEKLQMFKVDYSVLKKKKIVNSFVMIKSVEDTDEIVKLAKLDISTKERVFIQDVKILKFKPFSS